MKLTPHFTLAEMTASSKKSYLKANREDALKHLRTLVLVCELLEAVRAHFGKPVIVHSGHRYTALNTAIGGSKTSQHRVGQAADFHVQGVDLREVFDWIRSSDLKWGQLILEGNKKGKPSWIHISLGAPYRKASKSQQVLIMDAGKWTRL